MLRRYILLQIPGWIGVLAVLAVLYVWFDLPLWVCVVVSVGWLIKDAALYPVLRHAYALESNSPGDRLLGRSVTAGDQPGSTGYVRLDGELWKARLADDSGPVEPGTRGHVVDVRGLTLYVRPDGAPE